MILLTAKSGMGKGASWPIGERPLLVGRGSGCDVRIPDTVVSRRHCEIVMIEGVVQVRDLDSLNTVLVNGRPVTHCALTVGDEIRIGRAIFLITQEEEAGDEVPSELQRHSTVALKEEDSVLLFGQQTKPVADEEQCLQDNLAELFRLSRSLSRATSVEVLTQTLGEALCARLRPDHAWLLLFSGTGAELVPLAAQRTPAEGPADAPRDLMMMTVKERQGALFPKQADRYGPTVSQWLLAAPIFLGEHEIGAVGLLREHPSPAYDDRDLDFLVALAHTVAPFFGAIEHIEELEAENKRLRVSEQKLTTLVGDSKEMRRVRQIAKVAAPSDQTVLITGDTGTGKELVAALIHELSGRAAGELVRVNCAATPRDLFESEFFGYEKGAFTGASSRKIGLMEQSNGGTLFLDEIGDLSLDNQGRILRAVETGEFRRVGGSKEIRVDFRVVAATNKDLPSEIQNGRFREDLYHRVKAIEIFIPPLRERRSDIPSLAEHFLAGAWVKTNKPDLRLSPEAVEYLVGQPWPGNVRQLKNAIETAATFCQGTAIEVDDLRAFCRTSAPVEAPCPLADVERQHILKALEYCDGNVVEAASMLGISKSTLYTRLGQYGVKQ